MGLLDEVRASAARIVRDARFVRIEYERLAEYARALPRPERPELDRATHFFGTPDETLAFVVTLDAINFGSGYFPHVRKRAGMSGYFTVAASLKDRFEAHGPYSPAELCALDAGRCAAVFGQSLEDPAVAELMELFAGALRDLGVAALASGGFRGLVARADGSAERLASVLAEAMPFYQDVGFYKRAQLTAADLSTAGVAEFSDLDRLTIFADNLVPHVLRVDGILVYDAELLARINREELLVSGSQEEREIRACALHAVELMVGHAAAAAVDAGGVPGAAGGAAGGLPRTAGDAGALPGAAGADAGGVPGVDAGGVPGAAGVDASGVPGAAGGAAGGLPRTAGDASALPGAAGGAAGGLRGAAGRRVTAMELDYVLWNRGQGPFYKARPRHRARSVFY